MIPQTPDQLWDLLYRTIVSRVYGDITSLAVQRKLNEHEIAAIERNVLSYLDEMDKAAPEFTTFESEPVVARLKAHFEEFFKLTRDIRLKARK